MNSTTLPTEFAPAERTEAPELERQRDSLAELPLLKTLLDAMPVMVAILNSTRQIVFYNSRLAETVQEEGAGSPVGLRPGDILDCSHACETPGGCGTTRFCSVCGVLKAALAGLSGCPAVEEARILAKDPARSSDLRVRATPFRHQGKDFVIFAMEDVSHERRKSALEGIFFHDVLNTASVVLSATELLAEADAAEREGLRHRAVRASRKLIDEILAQRDLSAAERGELEPRPVPFSARGFLAELVDLWAHESTARDRSLRLTEDCADAVVRTDPVLLSRVLGNMIKNALEAAPAGSAVEAGAALDGDGVVFRVKGSSVMPEAVKLRVFQRSFSTKAASGRGLGTYGMRLLAESYLKGKVWFESAEGAGTTFYVRIPAQPA
ncbi:MAG: PAS domain-containing sensor histidine kinase [Elusimicrobiota bacterium]|jgi:signal transduction histidine kinase